MQFLSLRSLLVVLLALTAGGCVSNIDLLGNQPLPENLAQIQPGRVTKSDVVALIGSPASVTPFGDEKWYYISSKVETIAFFKPEELERQVLELTFDKKGMVVSMRQLQLADGRVVDMVSRETPTAGKDLSFIEQLLGNVGKFNKGDKDRASGP